jgi:hypothetical protein
MFMGGADAAVTGSKVQKKAGWEHHEKWKEHVNVYGWSLEVTKCVVCVVLSIATGKAV